MEVTYLSSAAIHVDDGETSVLCDPWLVDGAYYGSWAHYPPIDADPEDFDDVDFIYLSHVHPDHFHPDTLRRMSRDIPVLIHDYRWPYLREAVEELGFEAIELPHDERVNLAGDMHINVLAADGCDPELCGNFFGCNWYDPDADRTGSTQVDTMAVIDSGEFTVVNTNDCPYPIAESVCRRVADRYGDVDLLCHQYSAAQFYPQAVTNYDHERLIAERDRVIREKHELALNFLDVFDPSYYMPFAGEYVLAGRLADRNEYTANPPREEAREFFTRHGGDDRECVFLNSGEHIDLSDGSRSAPFRPIDRDAKRRYIEEVLSERSFTYEADGVPSLAELRTRLSHAYENMEAKRKRIGYETDTTVYISLVDGVYAAVSMNGDGYEFTRDPDHDVGYVQLDLDPRLLSRLLEGTHRAHWADAKIGSHLGIRKEPDVYERGLYNCLGDLYASGVDVDDGTATAASGD